MAGLKEQDLTTVPDTKLTVWNLSNARLLDSYNFLALGWSISERLLDGYTRGEEDTGAFGIKCQECESESQWHRLSPYPGVRVSFDGRSHLVQHSEE